MPVAQGRHGYLTIGGTQFPVDSFSVDSPRNLQGAQPMANTWGTNLAEGLKTSRITVNFAVRAKATEVLALSFWQNWMSRSWSGGFDDTTALALVAASGRRTFTIASAKAESFTLVVMPGRRIGLTGVFLAPAQPTRADQTPVSYANTFDNEPPLMFDAFSVSGVTGGLYGLEVTYSNNHLANGPLNGTKNLTSWDAGIMTCGAVFTVPDHLAAGEPFADAATISFTLTGTGPTTRTFSLTKCTADPINSIAAQPGQNYQRYATIVNGDASTAPLVIT